MHTKHSLKRIQQRAIPPIVQDWLSRFGETEYGSHETHGHGVLKLYFSQKSLRKMQRELGKKFVDKNREFLKYYLLEDSHTGKIITMGIRYKPVKRK